MVSPEKCNQNDDYLPREILSELRLCAAVGNTIFQLEVPLKINGTCNGHRMKPISIPFESRTEHAFDPNLQKAAQNTHSIPMRPIKETQHLFSSNLANRLEKS